MNKAIYECTQGGLLRLLEQFDKAAQKFIKKVESGRAHSVETYADLKACCDAFRKYIEIPHD